MENIEDGKENKEVLKEKREKSFLECRCTLENYKGKSWGKVLFEKCVHEAGMAKGLTMIKMIEMAMKLDRIHKEFKEKESLSKQELSLKKRQLKLDELRFNREHPTNTDLQEDDPFKGIWRLNSQEEVKKEPETEPVDNSTGRPGYDNGIEYKTEEPETESISNFPDYRLEKDTNTDPYLKSHPDYGNEVDYDWPGNDFKIED